MKKTLVLAGMIMLGGCANMSHKSLNGMAIASGLLTTTSIISTVVSSKMENDSTLNPIGITTGIISGIIGLVTVISSENPTEHEHGEMCWAKVIGPLLGAAGMATSTYGIVKERQKQNNCVIGCPCGDTCISCSYHCWK